MNQTGSKLGDFCNKGVTDRLLYVINKSQTKTWPHFVPAITVKLSNSSTEEIRIAARSDFFLWLPGSGIRHAIGKYEFHTTDGDVPNNGQISVEPNKTVTLYAQVLNQQLYGRILEQAECDISLHIRRVHGGLTFSQNLPFTKEAIKKYYVTADVS